MERDQIEESKNRTIYNSGTIAVIDSVYEERELPNTGFLIKISFAPTTDTPKIGGKSRKTARQCCMMAASWPGVAFWIHQDEKMHHSLRLTGNTPWPALLSRIKLLLRHVEIRTDQRQSATLAFFAWLSCHKTEFQEP